MKPHRWENRAAGRYYEATVLRNLFGEWEVLCVWGGIASLRGSHQSEPVADPSAGEHLLERIARRREKRGYTRRAGQGA